MVERYLIALSIVGLVDAVSYMVVAPSIIFYVLQLGGTKEQYGIILSAFSFASFCAKPVLGAWSDRMGFRIPYVTSLAISGCGGLSYLLASLYTDKLAIGIVLAGRLLGGVGAASSALGFAYLAKIVPNDQQTKVNSLLSALRIVGMAAGPGVNVFLDKIDVSIGQLHLDPLNSVGLVLIGSNVLALISILFLLEEPPRDESKTSSEHKDASPWSLVTCAFCAEILVPILGIFSFNAAFQLVETGFAPAASHALGWGPIECSAALGSISIAIFIVMLIVYLLSARKVPDNHLLYFGLCLSAVGYALIYLLWVMGAPAWHFVVPMVIAVSSFPFLGAPTRSVFTKSCSSKPALAEYRGTMQAVLSMFASVAGFVTPGLASAYVLRDPAEVEASKRHRELTPLALFAPSLSLLTLVGFIYVEWKLSREYKMDVELGVAPDETTSLKPERRHTFTAGDERFSPRVEAYRRQSACLMGLPQSSMYDEHDHPDERNCEVPED